MGSMIYLAIGRLQIEWGKNYGRNDHSALFQGGDVTSVPYAYVDGGGEHYIEHRVGLSKPLPQVTDRLRLLGCTQNVGEGLYAEAETELDLTFIRSGMPSFSRMTEIAQAMPLEEIVEGNPLDWQKFFPEYMLRLLGADLDDEELWRNFETMAEYTPANALLWIFSNHPKAADIPVIWAFADLEAGGWGRRQDFVRPLDRSNRFLLVTEGSSDAKIIAKAFALLQPHVADFFDYVDMGEGYPFTGTGNMLNFMRGLIGISIINNLVFIFDNDTEGVLNFNKAKALNRPPNMEVIRLPEETDLWNFPTKGPDGDHLSDINGEAAGIECYLDLDDTAHVRWTSWNRELDRYQGELVGKDRYKKAFLSQKEKVEGYNYKRIANVLALIVKQCVAMKEDAWFKAMEEEEDYDEDDA